MARTSRHLVVDGSNIATEGRTVPSLAQLDEAVRAIQAENEDRQITVIVDATFAHRIDESERPAFEEASDNGEILMPPAGAVGRGDAFILQVAEKADAAVLSNDSFQEFHGVHPWLFDEGRLIGGKPVEGVGWVFVDRIPVRGPASRRATREAKRGRSTKKSSGRSRPSKAAQGPPPVPSADKPPPSGRGRKAESKTATKSATKAGAKAESKTAAGAESKTATKSATKAGAKTGSKSATKAGSKTGSKPATKAGSGAAASTDGGAGGGQSARKRGRGSKKRQLEELNSPRDFLGFVTRYSIGDEVEAVVERYSSHGCYVQAAGAQCYLPSSAMGDPAPNRARDVVSLGQTAIVRVESLDSDRRGINVELVRTVDDEPAHETSSTGTSRRRKQGKTSQQPATVADDSAGEANTTRSETTVATKKSAKKATRKAAKKTTKKAPAKATASARAAKATARKAAKKATTGKSAKKAPAKKAAKKATAKKAPAKKAAKKATAKKAPAKKAPPKKATKKATAKKATTKKAAKKTPARKTAKKATKKATAKKATKKAPAKKATKKATAKKAPTKKATKRR